MNNKFLIDRGATTAMSHTVVPELKRYVRNGKTSYDNLKQQRRRTDTLHETLHDRQMVFQDCGFSGS